MKYLAQVRTQRFDGFWTHWVSIGDPMDEAQADEWLTLQTKLSNTLVEFRLICVPNDYPMVFSRPEWFTRMIRFMSF